MSFNFCSEIKSSQVINGENAKNTQHPMRQSFNRRISILKFYESFPAFSIKKICDLSKWAPQNTFQFFFQCLYWEFSCVNYFFELWNMSGNWNETTNNHTKSVFGFIFISHSNSYIVYTFQHKSDTLEIIYKNIYWEDFWSLFHNTLQTLFDIN